MKKILIVVLLALSFIACQKEDVKPQKTFDVNYFAYSKNAPFTVVYFAGEPGKSITEIVNQNTFEKKISINKYDFQMDLIVKCFTVNKIDSIYGSISILDKKKDMGYSFQTYEGKIEVKLNTPKE